MIMISVLEKQYMETVIQMGRRMNSGEIDWEQRRYEIAKDCLVSLMPEVTRGIHDLVIGFREGNMDKSYYYECVKEIADGAIDVALNMTDVLVSRLQEPKAEPTPKSEKK